MLFRLLGFRSEYIFYDFIWSQEKEEILETGIEFVSENRIKSLDYLFAVLQVTRNLPLDIRENIFILSLIIEFREEIFIRKFEEQLQSKLELLIAAEDLSDNSDYSIEIDYLNYNSDLEINYLTD